MVLSIFATLPASLRRPINVHISWFFEGEESGFAGSKTLRRYVNRTHGKQRSLINQILVQHKSVAPAIYFKFISPVNWGTNN